MDYIVIYFAVLSYYRRSSIFALSAIFALLSVTGCANSPTGEAFERSLAVDPLLKDSPPTFASPSPSPTGTAAPNEPLPELPSDFPGEIPRYPNAQLQNVTPSSSQLASSKDASSGVSTQWRTTDTPQEVESFYHKQFQDNNWQILKEATDAQANTLKVRRGELLLSVSVQPESVAATEFRIDYILDSGKSAATPSNVTTPAPTASPSPTPPSAGGSPSPTPSASPPTAKASPGSGNSSEPTQVSEQFQQYIADLEKLGVLTPASGAAKSNSPAAGDKFDPSKTISRREYARWLVATNNKIQANRPAQQIRLATSSSEPAFQDVPRTDADFPAIQGLAEAGILPSSLSGDTAGVLFRPDAPVTREQLILWKVPLDTRRPLPTASVDAVQQTWGFQDAAKIDPKALRAVLADSQNGDLANIRRAFGYTTLFQPKKPVTRAEAAAALWYFGVQGEGLSAQDVVRSRSSPGQ